MTEEYLNMIQIIENFYIEINNKHNEMTISKNSLEDFDEDSTNSFVSAEFKEDIFHENLNLLKELVNSTDHSEIYEVIEEMKENLYERADELGQGNVNSLEKSLMNLEEKLDLNQKESF